MHYWSLQMSQPLPPVIEVSWTVNTDSQHGPLVRELMESLQIRYGGLLTNVGILDEAQNNSFVDLVYPMASLLEPNYGSVWLEDDLPISVGIEDAVQQ